MKGESMFLCFECGNSSQPGEKVNKVVIKTRKKAYLNDDKTVQGHGTEIVKEIQLCAPCSDTYRTKK